MKQPIEYKLRGHFHSGKNFIATCPKCKQQYSLPVEWSNTTCNNCPGIVLEPRKHG